MRATTGQGSVVRVVATAACCALFACGRAGGLTVKDGGAPGATDGVAPADGLRARGDGVPPAGEGGTSEVATDGSDAPGEDVADVPLSPDARAGSRADASDISGDAWAASDSPAFDVGAGPADWPPSVDGTDAGVVAPSGGCVSTVVTPSLAFRGTIALDFDEDGISDDDDNCPALATMSTVDSDGDGLGDGCDHCVRGPDRDGDGICDDTDNCPGDWNPSQYDIDGDGIGDRCDTQRCASGNGAEQVQRLLRALVRRPELAGELASSHWRVLGAQTYCASSSLGARLEIVDYTHRKQLSVTYIIASDEIIALKVAAFVDLLGPQPSAEEGREAVYLAERDPQVRAVLDSLRYVISSGPFFYEFGRQPEDNDPTFPTCATGRCIDVVYSGYAPDGARADCSVVVEMGACKVLGVKQRN